MKCTKCGNENGPGSFCVFCGSPLVASVPTTAPIRKKTLKRNRTVILCVSVALIAAVFACVAIAVLMHSGTDDYFRDDYEYDDYAQYSSENVWVDLPYDLPEITPPQQTQPYTPSYDAPSKDSGEKQTGPLPSWYVPETSQPDPVPEQQEPAEPSEEPEEDYEEDYDGEPEEEPEEEFEETEESEEEPEEDIDPESDETTDPELDPDVIIAPPATPDIPVPETAPEITPDADAAPGTCTICGSPNHTYHPSCPVCGSFEHINHIRCTICNNPNHTTEEHPE